MEEKNTVLATVNGLEITEALLEATIEKFPEDKKAYFSSEFGKKQLLDQIINVELINAYGREIGIESDEFYRTQMEQAEKDIRFNATMNQIMSGLSVDDEEVKAHYDSNPSAFSKGETIAARHILVDSKEKAETIKGQIEAGAVTFEAAAKEHSSCPSKESGGDLGRFGQGSMVPEFDQAAFSAPLNEVSEPVKTMFGYHLIQVYDRAEAEAPAFEAVRESIAGNLLKDKQMERYTTLVQELREKYYNK
ncbi:Peptidyl-prolyl cis-trans isomerase PpiD [Clostridiaceae bacterium JG1575]|nr:Peptidyl-prolyl cis-trans isomerase PpiD [Clostridiaceae bacterium JG1575]